MLRPLYESSTVLAQKTTMAVRISLTPLCLINTFSNYEEAYLMNLSTKYESNYSVLFIFI